MTEKDYGCGISVVTVPGLPATINIKETKGLLVHQAMPFKAALELAIIDCQKMEEGK